MKNSFLINEKSNLYINIAEYIENCGDNPFTRRSVHGKLVHQEPLRNLSCVESFIVSVNEINDKYQVLLFNKNYILNGPEANGIIGLNEILRYEVSGVCDARIWYEITITKEKAKLSDLRHNSDLSRLDIITEKDKHRAEKYQKAIKLLESVEEK